MENVRPFKKLESKLNELPMNYQFLEVLINNDNSVQVNAIITINSEYHQASASRIVICNKPINCYLPTKLFDKKQNE